MYGSPDAFPSRNNTEIRQVESFAEEIANEKMTGKLYTMGQVYAGKEMEETVVAMSAEPLAYSLARLDRQKGKITYLYR